MAAPRPPHAPIPQPFRAFRPVYSAPGSPPPPSFGTAGAAPTGAKKPRAQSPGPSTPSVPAAKEAARVGQKTSGRMSSVGLALLGSLLSQAETGDGQPVSLNVLVAEVRQEPPSPPDQLKKAASRVMIMPMRPEVVGEAIDPFGQEGDLDLRRPRIGVVDPEIGDDVVFLCPLQRHTGGASPSVYRSMQRPLPSGRICGV